MSDNESIKLVIHYGGSVSKEDNDYRYIGQLGCESVQWKASEIRWENFETFLKDSKVLAPIALIWYKEVAKEMSELKYVFDNMNVDMGELRLVGQVAGEIHVFIQHECLEHVNRREDDDDGHDADEDVDDNDDNEDESEDDDEERPRENDEPEKSEDETPAEENVHENQEKDMVGEGDQNVVDDGDEVVIDAGNGADDERFNSLFEEGAKCKKPDCHDDEEKDEEAREVEESDEEYKGYELGDDEYPDTPVESDEEWEQWTNQKISKGKGNSKFHGDFDKPPYIWLFQKFHSGLEFKDQLLRYSLNTQYDVKMAKSEANRIAAICCKEKCKWRVYCSVEVPLNKWMVKVCHMNHNHGKSSRVSMLKQGVIAGLFREELRRNINLPASEIKDTIKARYNIVVPISKCYRGRRIALDTIVQAQSIQFGMLWDYEAELIRTHPRITTEVCTVPVNGGQMFDCFYICFEEFREAWKNNCRPVIGLDGCFLKWELTGDLLSAVGRDADNRMFPIAWAVVRGENKDTWAWFIKKLKQDLDLGEGDNVTIISDKQKGLVIAVGNELRKAEHRMCARHIYANWKKTFSRSEYKNLFWGVAYSYNEGEYNDKMKLIESYDPAAHASLVSLEPHRWCRAFFSLESRCHDVHNNLSEAFNRTIKIARSKPVLNLLEDIRRQAMRRISRRYMKAYNCDTILTPITMAILEKARVDNKHCSMIKSSSSLYEVLEFALTCSYTVNITTHECACRRWDLTGIPCKHAICVLDDEEKDPVNYVSHYYSSTLMTATYKENIKPVNGEKLWKKTHRTPIRIPEFRKPRGRPKNRDRRKEPFEDLQNKGKTTRHGRTFHCSRCGQAGHIKSGCRNEVVIVEGPKNRRGRPRKNPDDVLPRRPTQQRKKRKTSLEVSNSQPLQEGESSTPQPSLSSNKAKPPVKKTKRGKPLKITKACNFSRGAAKLMSPFTDRAFDVFKDRAGQFTSPSEPPQ